MRGRRQERTPSYFFIYAPCRDPIARVQKRVAAAADIDRLIRMTDRQRADYIRMYFRVQLERSAPVSHADSVRNFGKDCVTG